MKRETLSLVLVVIVALLLVNVIGDDTDTMAFYSPISPILIETEMIPIPKEGQLHPQNVDESGLVESSEVILDSTDGKLQLEPSVLPSRDLIESVRIIWRALCRPYHLIR